MFPPCKHLKTKSFNDQNYIKIYVRTCLASLTVTEGYFLQSHLPTLIFISGINGVVLDSFRAKVTICPQFVLLISIYISCLASYLVSALFFFFFSQKSSNLDDKLSGHPITSWVGEYGISYWVLFFPNACVPHVAFSQKCCFKISDLSLLFVRDWGPDPLKLEFLRLESW